MTDEERGQVKIEATLMQQEKTMEENCSKKKVFLSCIPARFVLTFLSFCSMMLVYCNRVTLNVAIVAMVNQTALDDFTQHENKSHGDDACPDLTQVHNITSKYKQGQYAWSPSTQGWILGGIYYGYLVSQMFGGWLAQKVGAKLLNALALMTSSLLTLFIPYATTVGAGAVFAIRVIQGAAQGLNYPAIYTLFSRWVPSTERSTTFAICTIGTHVGTVITMTLTAYLTEYGFADGWPSAFYVFGVSGCVVTFLWLVLVHSSPEDHPRITDKELRYILDNVPQQEEGKKKPQIPWKQILTSGTVWATFVAKTTWCWGFITLLTKLPSYLDLVLHLPIEKNGVVNSLMYAALSICTVVSGYAADYIRKKSRLSTTTIRKMFETGGLMGPALCLVAIPFAGCNIKIVTALLLLAMSSFGMIAGGDIPIVGDMSPEFAGIIFGMTNGPASVAGFIAPLVAGLFLDRGNASLYQWSLVFYLSSAIYSFGAIFFLVFASAELQPWGTSKPEKEEVVEERKSQII